MKKHHAAKTITLTKKVLLWFVGTLLVLFLVFNMVGSQTIPSLYRGFVNEERETVVSYLKQIRNTSSFWREYDRFKEIYGVKIEEEVFSVEYGRRKEIQKYEEILTKNPNAKEAHYQLFILYHLLGEENKSLDHLTVAKKLDPEL